MVDSRLPSWVACWNSAKANRQELDPFLPSKLLCCLSQGQTRHDCLLMATTGLPPPFLKYHKGLIRIGSVLWWAELLLFPLPHISFQVLKQLYTPGGCYNTWKGRGGNNGFILWVQAGSRPCSIFKSPLKGCGVLGVATKMLSGLIWPLRVQFSGFVNSSSIFFLTSCQPSLFLSNRVTFLFSCNTPPAHFFMEKETPKLCQCQCSQFLIQLLISSHWLCFSNNADSYTCRLCL